MDQPASPLKVTARALLLAERIETSGLERSDLISSAPLAFRVGERGFAAFFRYGIAVLVGLTPIEEDDVLRKVRPRLVGTYDKIEDEAVTVTIDSKGEDAVPPGGPIQLKDLSPARLLVLADILAKTVALGRDEKELSAVFDIIEPLARRLSSEGRTPTKRRDTVRLIGRSLLANHRIAGRVAIDEKPDVLWDRPDLERLYARLEDEYEVKERAFALANKVRVLNETAHALTDLIDTQRSQRLELLIVLLFVAELILSAAQFWFAKG